MTRVPYKGAALTVLFLALLLTPPGDVIARSGAFADSRADVFTPHAVPVALRDGLTGDPARVVPARVGNWSGVEDASWTRDLGEYLAYDNLLVREYSQPGMYVPVQVMILTARHAHAFHNPEVCFRVQGGDVHVLEPTHVTAPAAADDAEAPVGRLLIRYPDANGTDTHPPKLVYNLYVVERHALAADRTTWIRLSLPGASPDALDQYEPLLVDLLDALAPFLFEGTGTARTTAEWVQRAAGTPIAIAAGLVALAPVTAEWAWQRRGRGEGDA